MWHDNCKDTGMKVATVISVFIALAAPAPVLADEPLSFTDPTRPSTEEGASDGVGGFVLQSTLVSPTRKLAIINGRALRVGATIGQAVVTDIKPYEVILNNAGQEIHLRLTPKLEKERKVTTGNNAS